MSVPWVRKRVVVRVRDRFGNSRNVAQLAADLADRLCIAHGEKRTPEPETAAVAGFDIVIVVPEIAVIVVPNGTFGCEMCMPMDKPAADATVAVTLLNVVVIVVDTCMMFDAEPLALSRPTPTWARFGIPNVVLPSPTPYGANTSGVRPDPVAA